MKQAAVKLLMIFLVLSCAGFAGTDTDSLRQVIRSTGQDTVHVNALNDLAYSISADSSDEARKYAREALTLANELNFDYGRLNAYMSIGLSWYYANKYDSALANYSTARLIAQRLQNHTKLASIINNTGLIYDDKGDYDKAINYYLQALQELERSKNGSKRLEANILNNIGLIYQTLGRYDQALDFYHRSLKLKEEIGNLKGAGNTLHNIGLVNKLKGDYDTALTYYMKALEIRKKVDDLSGLALTLNNIGSLYEAQGQYDKAYPYLRESYEIRLKQKDQYNLAICMFSIGSNLGHRHQAAEGLSYMNQAIAIAQKLGAKDLLRLAYEQLAEFYAVQKDYAKAYEYEKKLLVLKDSILNKETSEQINELQTRYESEKKEKEIALLTKNQEIQDLQLNRKNLLLVVLFSSVLLILALVVLLYNRYSVKKRANDMLAFHNKEITQQKKELTDSINYAKRIQESILPPQAHWKSLLPSSFIFYRPKDIVSGDFYWIEQKNGIVCFAAVDCTGHGVPGALMSVVGFNLLTQAVNEVGLTRPADILKHLDSGVTRTLRQSGEGKGVKDGMDLSLCSLDLKTKILEYAGAFNSLYYVRAGILYEVKADKFPIGVNLDDKADEYSNHRLELQSGDSVYLFSDGYADQFGGPAGKKFKYNQLKQLLIEVSALPPAEQEIRIADRFAAWKGSLEQVDDVLVLGLRI